MPCPKPSTSTWGRRDLSRTVCASSTHWRPRRFDSVGRLLACLATVVALVALAPLGRGEDRQRRGLGGRSHLRKRPGGEAEDPAAQTCFWVCALAL